MAKKWGARHMSWVRGFKSRGRKRNARRRRRNPWPMAGVVANPRRRRRRSLRANPRRRRSYRRNPSLGSMFKVGGVGLPSMETMAFAGVGFLVPPFLESFVAPYLPAAITQNVVGKYAFKVGSVLGTTFLAKKVLGNNAAKAVALGGSVYILASAVMEFAPQFIVGGVRQVVAAQPAQVQSYLKPRQVMSYTNRQLAASPFTSGRMTDTAKRFQRF